MTAEENERAYQFIKDRDKPHLKEVVDILKSQNLDVYISGSAIMVPEYSDIDLLICDPSIVIKETVDKEEFEISPRAQTAVDTVMNRDGVNLRKQEQERSGGYSGSKISGYRWELNYKGTYIDISYAQEPFGLTREKIAKLEQEAGVELGLEPVYEKF
jgi:hypothetical protein